MPLAVVVGSLVLAAVLVVAISGWMIDKSAGDDQ